MDREAMLPAVETFVARMREACAAGPEGEARWQRCRDLLVDLLADPDLKAHAQTWPIGGFDGKKVDNLLFYVDPDYGFALNGLIKKPGGRAMVHDHGPAWTVYGVLEGTERIVRFESETDTNGAPTLRESHSVECSQGDVDIVPPHEIHSEFAGDQKSIAFIVRSQKTGTFKQRGFENTLAGEPIPGPNQVPFALS
jgi:predicted metal-dependent enzyme (double-stranded beta helix superfamily)